MTTQTRFQWNLINEISLERCRHLTGTWIFQEEGWVQHFFRLLPPVLTSLFVDNAEVISLQETSSGFGMETGGKIAFCFLYLRSQGNWHAAQVSTLSLRLRVKENGVLLSVKSGKFCKYSLQGNTPLFLPMFSLLLTSEHGESQASKKRKDKNGLHFYY